MNKCVYCGKSLKDNGSIMCDNCFKALKETG